MNVIVVGLGRMGSGLAKKLDRQGYSVTAIDQDPDKFDALGEDFMGQKVVGVGFDRGVLTKAKVERASAVIACTASDEANIVIAHVARSTYRVPRACELLTYHELDTVTEIGSGDVQLVRADVPTLLEGHPVRDLTVIGEITITAISRNNETFIPTLGTLLGHGDVIFAVVSSNSTAKFTYMLGDNR